MRVYECTTRGSVLVMHCNSARLSETGSSCALRRVHVDSVTAACKRSAGRSK